MIIIGDSQSSVSTCPDCCCLFFRELGNPFISEALRAPRETLCEYELRLQVRKRDRQDLEKAAEMLRRVLEEGL